FYLSSCLCPPGQFDVGQLECAKCHYSCFQCFDNTAEGCINCSIDFHLRVLKGNTCKCIDGYYDEPGSSKCKKCSYKCETCEEQAEKCLSCPLNQLRTFDSTTGCLCPGEYYDQQNVIICQKCHFKCKNCSAQTESSCLSCDPLSYREIKLQQCKCQPHYFEMEVQECAICSALCYECVDRLDNCTSCYDDRYLIGNKCQCASKFQGASISTFEFNGMCHYSCATCGGKEEIDCISCIDTDNRYQVGNTCVCKEGYYDAGLPVCQKCSYKCKGCSKQSEYCTSCQDNSLRQLVSDFKTCKCNQRYYGMMDKNEVCQQCHYSCLRCNDIDTKCELCSFESNRIYNDQLFSCDCDFEICQKCHYSCLNCNSGYSSSCIQCVDSNISNRVFYNNTCKCLFGYFDDGQSIKCQKCDVQCLSCINQSYQCLSCPQTRKLETNCKCQQGYYDIGLQLCQKCNSICSACEFTSNNCTQCDSDQFRELNEITKTCDCQIGYLELNGICQQCDQSCKICQQQLNHCTSCVQFRKLNNNNCICIDGMFESIQDKQCKLCHKTCLTCAYSDQYCLTCSVDNFRIFKSGNTCECIQGYYENQITYACEQCSKSCLTCSQQYNNCLTCDTTLNLSLINNQCLCSQSYYFNSLTNSCQQCNITCLDCQIQNECTSCKLTTRHLDQDQKKCICNDGYYETNQANCQQCHLSCETCINIDTNCLSCMSISNRILTNNQCLCIQGYYDAGIEICQKCNGKCKTCQSSALTCLSCYQIEQNRYQSTDKCLCKSGYFESNTDICQKCSNECLTCQGSPDYCTSCDTNSKRIDQSFIHKCPCIIGFYQDQNQICQKCHYKCQTCINVSDQCLSCKFELNSNRKSLSDQCNCKEGYYDDGTQSQCQKCNVKCKSCINDSNNCQICQNSIRFKPPMCNCIDGYYEDSQLTCQMCAYQCNTCATQPQNCLTCKPGRSGNDCKCSDGYFENGSILCDCINYQQSHIECAFQCDTCSNSSSNCNKCKGNRIQEPQCICQPGYFDDQLNEDCQLCDSSCLECNKFGCLSCNANRIINDDMNCVPPPNSIWYYNTPWCSTCQVAVIKVYLSDDIRRIIIHFDFVLNSKSFNSQFELNKCLQLFELESVSNFGLNCQCFLDPDDNNQLFITLGENSKINVGDELLFLSNSLSHVNCETTLNKFIFPTLQLPLNPLAPQIEYIVPLHKLNPYTENSVYLKSIKNYGFRKLTNINWTVQAETSQITVSLSDFITQINLLQEQNLLIPKLTLPGDEILKFKIQYENFINIHSQSEFTIQTHSGCLPYIEITAKPQYFVYETITISLSANTMYQSNETDSSKYQIEISEIDRQPQKSSSSQLNKSLQSNPFEKNQASILKYTLSPNTTYTFQINASNLNTNKAQQQNLSIYIPYAGLICKFNNKGIQSIRKDLNLQIQCRDLDTIYDWNTDPDLYVQVASLAQINQNNQLMSMLQIHFNLLRRIQFLPQLCRNGQSQQPNLTKFTNLHKLSFFLRMISLFLDLEFNEGYLMRQVNNYEQLNFTFLIPFNQKSQLLDLSIALIYNYQIIAILQPKYFSHQFKLFNSLEELKLGNNINLKFTAQYTNNIMPSLNTIKLTINQPPICSKLTITRSNDQALSNMMVTTTCQYSDDSPYKYELRVFLREQDLTDFLKGSSDNSLIFYPYQSQTQFQILISYFSGFFKNWAFIIRGSTTPIYELITSTPAKINCSQIQFTNLNLQNKISLLFEAMNQKCNQLHNQIYLDLLYQQILPDQNDNILKFQAIKLYRQFLIQFGQTKPKNRLLFESNQKGCYDKNSGRFFITQNEDESNSNSTTKIEELQDNVKKLDSSFKYFRGMKKQSEEGLNQNNYVWNQELFQQLQNFQGGLTNLLYFVDELYSNFLSANTTNTTIYSSIVELLKYKSTITYEIQNNIVVNDQPLYIEGKDMIFQLKKRTKKIFNQQFNVEPTFEDYIIDFIQYESTFLSINPLIFSPEQDKILQQHFKDKTMQILSDNYYLIKLFNVIQNRYLKNENISSQFGTKFGTYESCSNQTQKIKEYEILCISRTVSGGFSQCNLNKIENNETIELTCKCQNFGEIFLVSSTNFSVDVFNNSTEETNFTITSIKDDFFILIICTSLLTIILFGIYIFQLIRDLKDNSDDEMLQEVCSVKVDVNKMMYKGSSTLFKQKFKEIHQVISLVNYKDQQIKFSYRILEVISQINLLLTFNIVEFYFQSLNKPLIFAFMIVNPIIVFILRIAYKIIEAIYRFRNIPAIISSFILIILLILPNIVLFIMYRTRSEAQSEIYLMAIIFFTNILISQTIIEAMAIFGRISIYRYIASSLKQMEFNPLFHLMHFFVLHSCLEDIYDEFLKI
ncbi:unnamed protein product, partial (macronuclear) [Paramecium tetraurelia]